MSGALPAVFTPAHHGGEGSPMVCLHGFTGTWRVWEPVLPALQRHHEVLAPTLAGHAGGPPLPVPLHSGALADAVERAMDTLGWDTAHVVGNSLGGHVALQLAERGRARTVVALAPVGGWAAGDDSFTETLHAFTEAIGPARLAAPAADRIMATPDGRRKACQYLTVRWRHVPADLLAHQLCGMAACRDAELMIRHAHDHGWPLDPSRITCPVRMVWGTEDRLLPWPSAARRFLDGWFPHADWVVLDDVGHCPQLDIPTECAALITGFTGS